MRWKHPQLPRMPRKQERINPLNPFKRAQKMGSFCIKGENNIIDKFDEM